MKSHTLTPVRFRAAATFAAAPESDGSRRFEGIAYHGGVVTDHPMFEAVAFDLASTKLVTPAPALFDHNEPIGVIDASTTEDSIAISGRLFSDIEGAAKKVTALADRGLPWQMSVGIWPGQIDQIKAGAKVKLNGRELEGPLTVFRQNRVREVSFVALGADDRTSANVFSLSEGGTRPQTSKETTAMTDATTVTQADHDAIVADLTTKLTAAQGEVRTALARVAELEAQFAARAKVERTAEVKAMFKVLNREPKDEEIAPYLEMTQEVFAAVRKDFEASKPAVDPSLFRPTATGGGSGVNMNDAEAIADAARKLIRERAADGVQLSVSQAVAAVRKAAA